jgi:hypothetical protein
LYERNYFLQKNSKEAALLCETFNYKSLLVHTSIARRLSDEIRGRGGLVGTGERGHGPLKKTLRFWTNCMDESLGLKEAEGLTWNFSASKNENNFKFILLNQLK